MRRIYRAQNQNTHWVNISIMYYINLFYVFHSCMHVRTCFGDRITHIALQVNPTRVVDEF